MRFLLLAALSITIAACSREVDASKLVERQGVYGVYYEVNSTTPFSGTMVSYHDNGQLEEKAQLRDGLRHGKSSRFFSNGQLQGVAEFEANKIVGVAEIYHENGQLARRANYADGQYDGLFESYYADGQSKETGTYAQGKKEGEWVRFSSDGSIEEWSNWENGTWHGVSLYVDTALDMEVAITRHERGVEQGEWLTYWIHEYPSYQLKRRTEYVSGQRNGHELQWKYDSGDLRRITAYKDDLEHGCSLNTRPSGPNYRLYNMGERTGQDCTISAEELAAFPASSSFPDPSSFLPEELRQYATW